MPSGKHLQQIQRNEKRHLDKRTEAKEKAKLVKQQYDALMKQRAEHERILAKKLAEKMGEDKVLFSLGLSTEQSKTLSRIRAMRRRQGRRPTKAELVEQRAEQKYKERVKQSKKQK